jgi:tetratricopeptide (TPR) repeat protein
MSAVLSHNHEANIASRGAVLHAVDPDRFGALALAGFEYALTAYHSDMQSKLLKSRGDEHLATYHVSHSGDTLKEAIGMYEEALRLRPAGHEYRAESLNDLGDALYYFGYHQGAEEKNTDRCIEVLREALHLRPPGHPARDRSLHNLARSLHFLLYKQRRDLGIMMECASLDREALQLRPPGHPERANSINNLANDLDRLVKHTGDTDMLAEMVSMRREVLRMWPLGHPLRDSVLENLGHALCVSFEHLGRSEHLAEALSMMREAAQLCPSGHPRRIWLLNNLAYALGLRSAYEGHSESLPEAITVYRLVLQLMSDNHPARAATLSNFAESLLESFRNSGDGNALNKAVSLLREAVSLQLPGADGYDDYLHNLAEALEARFDKDSDTTALSEAANLHRQALHYRPPGHSRRFASLECLARVLCKTESCSWPEALSYYQEALVVCPTGYSARALLLSGMSRCFLNSGSPLFSLSKGISCLSEAYADTLSHITGRLKSAISDLQQLEAAYAALPKGAFADTHAQDGERVLDLYHQVIGLLPYAANLGLDHGARLHAVVGSDEITRNAAARAVINGCFRQAIQMLEQGRGVFWTQTLHLHATTFDGIPEEDCQELQRMLRFLEHGARRLESSGQLTAQRERELEQRRQLNEAVQALISKIRGYSGLDRFLLPPAFDILFGSLPDGFVVIVNVSRLGHHALLLHRATGLETSLALKQFDTGFDCAQLREKLPRNMVLDHGHDSEDEARAMNISSGRKRPDFEDVLSRLWISIVHPIVDALGLHVSVILIAVINASNYAFPRKCKDVLGRGFGGA